MSKSRKVLHMVWVTSHKGTVGIGTFENELGEREIRASIVSGVNETADIKFVDDWGGKVDPMDLINLVGTFY